MEQIDWKTLGFDAYRTRTVVISHFKDGKWSKPESTETFSFTLENLTQRSASLLVKGTDQSKANLRISAL